MKRSLPLKTVLALVGLAIMVLGLNIGLGGIPTLGWQTSETFIAVTNETVFHVQDSHIRFIGGVWFGVGVIFLMGASLTDRLRGTMVTLSVAIAFAGLFRLSGLDGGVVFSAAILPSLALEIIGFPLLAVWLLQTPRPSTLSH